MVKNIFKTVIAVVLAGAFFSGCKKWEDHNAITDPKLGKNLLQQIQENADLSKFAGLLAKSGYDTVIATSKLFTVFAPVNAALAGLDPAIENDVAKLRQFVSNHISNQAVTTGSPTARVQMINGKYHSVQGTSVDDAGITTADQYAKNGYLQIIDKALPALPNAWELLQSGTAGFPANQGQTLLAYNDSTGVNFFLHHVADLADESKQYTLFVLTDTAWNSEVAKYEPYFVAGTTDSTTALAGNAIASDFVVEGLYEPSALPDSLTSVMQTKIGVDPSAIVETKRVSNGIVYVMTKLEVPPAAKFHPITVQGENFDFQMVDRTNQTYLRDKYNPVTGQNFRDVLVYNHDVPQFYLGYHLYNIPSITYKAYWVAVHDNINAYTGTHKQLLGIGTPASNLLPYTTVSPEVYNEVYLGEFAIDSFKRVMNVYLTADKSTNDNANKIVMDYFRLEPSF